MFEFVTEPFYEDPTELNLRPIEDPCDSILKSFAFFVVLTPVWGFMFSIEFLFVDGERFSFLQM